MAGRRAALPTEPFVLDRLAPSPDGACVVLWVHGRPAARVDPEVPAELGLGAGALVGGDLLPSLQAAVARRAAFDQGARLLGQRAISVAHLRRRLGAAWGPDAAEAALTRLGAYLDDETLARNWVAARLRVRPAGQAVLLGGLARMGIGRSQAQAAVREALGGGAARQMCLDAARRQAGRLAALPAEVRRRRLWGHLRRRGFGRWEIEAALQELEHEADDPTVGGER